MDVSEVLHAPPELNALRSDRPIALFLDFDGTLVNLAPRPDAIVVPENLAQRLHQLSRDLDGRLALVSGRAIIDLERHVGALQVARAGSHGIDRRLADGAALGADPAPLPDAAARALRNFAAEQGFLLESKVHGTALHYRNAPHLEMLGIEFATALADVHALQVKRGKCVVELVRPGADKGGAVAAFMTVRPFAGSVPIFVGDDVTDEDGFAAAEKLGGFGILVGERRPTAARYALPDPEAVYRWLQL